MFHRSLRSNETETKSMLIRVIHDSVVSSDTSDKNMSWWYWWWQIVSYGASVRVTNKSESAVSISPSHSLYHSLAPVPSVCVFVKGNHGIRAWNNKHVQMSLDGVCCLFFPKKSNSQKAALDTNKLNFDNLTFAAMAICVRPTTHSAAQQPRSGSNRCCQSCLARNPREPMFRNITRHEMFEGIII